MPKIYRKEEGYVDNNLSNKIDGIAGLKVSEFDIQGISQAIGGVAYRDRLTGQMFVLRNVADGVVVNKTWATADSDWILFSLKKLINIKPASIALFYNGGVAITSGSKSPVVGTSISDGTYRYMYLRLCKADSTGTEFAFQIINPFVNASATGSISWFFGISLTLNADKSITITYDSIPTFKVINVTLENEARIV